MRLSWNEIAEPRRGGGRRAITATALASSTTPSRCQLAGALTPPDLRRAHQAENRTVDRLTEI